MGDCEGTKRLYLRVPFKITEELKIKELHPDIIRVILPRQKSARWCYIEFDDHEKCVSAFQTLKKKKINGKGLKLTLKTQTIVKTKGKKRTKIDKQ